MALNCSSRSLIFGDDCAGKMLGCGCWSEEASPLSSCGVNSLWSDELEDGEESDPIACLPSDPFEMNLETTSAIKAAIASCIEDLTVRSFGQPFGSVGNDDLIAVDYTFVFDPYAWIDEHMGVHEHMGVFEGSFWPGGTSGGGDASQYSWLPPTGFCSQPGGFAESPSSSQYGILPCSDADDGASSGFMENLFTSQDGALACCDSVGTDCSGLVENQSSPHDASSVCCDAVCAAPGQQGNDAHFGMYFALGYLGLRDILSVEMTCKSLRSAVRSEYYPWKCIHIDSLLGAKMNDADLLRLTQKFPGVLRCLSLVQCQHLTDQGLKAVLQSNPQLTQLGIFGNVQMTHEGFINNLRLFNMEAKFGIKKLRFGNFSTLSKVQYEELLSLLKLDKGLALHKQEPRFLHEHCFYPNLRDGYAPDFYLPDLHDEYAIDIERCPLCDQYKHVYDCPAEGCNCRGCLVCIFRCLGCGRCIDILHDDYEETFTLDLVCLSCLLDGDT